MTHILPHVIRKPAKMILKIIVTAVQISVDMAPGIFALVYYNPISSHIFFQ
jgi:hypothetical protein